MPRRFFNVPVLVQVLWEAHLRSKKVNAVCTLLPMYGYGSLHTILMAFKLHFLILHSLCSVSEKKSSGHQPTADTEQSVAQCGPFVLWSAINRAVLSRILIGSSCIEILHFLFWEFRISNKRSFQWYYCYQEKYNL